MEAIAVPSLTTAELNNLAYAKSLLERCDRFERLSQILGRPLERGFSLLPESLSKTVYRSTTAALSKTLKVALSTLPAAGGRNPSERFHRLLVGVSGGIGGVFGLAALPIELPISTGIMLRSIADIARSEGHDVTLVETQLACLEVFALGGNSDPNDTAPSRYWAVRSALAKVVSEGALYLVGRGAMEEGATAITRLISAISARFGAVVSEEIAARSLPVIGAVGGSLINVLFLAHFQNMARGHFIVKRLETQYGTADIQRLYCLIE